MASNFCQTSVKITTARICQSLGWNSVLTTPLDLLVDIMERYLLTIGRTTQRFAEQFGRSNAEYGDALLALADIGVSLPDLLDYMKNVDPIEFSKNVPAFPIPKLSKLIYDDEADSDPLASSRSPAHNAASAGYSSSSPQAFSRRQLATASPDQPWQQRAPQDLENSRYQARCRLLLDGLDDGGNHGLTAAEEIRGRAPDPKPPLQMAQLMKQRRAPPVLPHSSSAIGGLASATYAGTSIPSAAVGVTARPKKEKLAAKVAAAARSKSQGKSGGRSSRIEPRRREKAAVVKKKKREEGYWALQEALKAAPLLLPPTERTRLPADDHIAATTAVSASRLEQPSDVGSRRAQSPSSVGVEAVAAACPSSKGRSSRGVLEDSATTLSSRWQNLDDTFDSVIRQGVEQTDEEDEEDRDVVDVEELGSSPSAIAASAELHATSQFGSPPSWSNKHTAAASVDDGLMSPVSQRNTVDDIIDSVVRGVGELEETDEDIQSVSLADLPSDSDTVHSSKKSRSEAKDERKHKKVKSKSRPKLAAAVEEGGRSPCKSSVPDEPASSLQISEEQPALVGLDRGGDDKALEVHEPIVDIIDDVEVVHEIELEQGEVVEDAPSMSGTSPGLSFAELQPSAADDVSWNSVDDSAAVSQDNNVAGLTVPLVGIQPPEKRREKHKKEKKEKKKKRNKERHRDAGNENNDDDRSHSQSKLHGHKDRKKGDKDRHKHRIDGGESAVCGVSEPRDFQRREHKPKDKVPSSITSSVFGGSDADAKHKAGGCTDASSPAVPKLLFKIAGKTISSIPQGDSEGTSAPLISTLDLRHQKSSQSRLAVAPAPVTSTEIYTETEFTGTSDLTDINQEADKLYICPGCNKPDDGTPMIGCDKCDSWYHWVCCNVLTEPPPDAEWYCPKCRGHSKKPPKKKSKH